jgi:hypothetical protein
MKHLLLTLIITSTSYSYINAQTSNNAKNYRVCRVDGVYRVCNDTDPLVVNTKQEINKPNATQVSMRKFDTYQRVETTTVIVMSNKKNKKLIVSYDEPNGAYKGESTQANGTFEGNRARNINYMNTSNPIPPIDGNNSSKH